MSIELAAWFVISAVGLLFAALNLDQAHKDNKAVKAELIANGRSVAARANLISQYLSVGKFTFMLSAGIVAAAFPGQSWTRTATVWSLVLMGLMIAVDSGWTNYATRKLLASARMRAGTPQELAEAVIEEAAEDERKRRQ